MNIQNLQQKNGTLLTANQKVFIHMKIQSIQSNSLESSICNYSDEYSDNYSDTLGSLWQFKKDDIEGNVYLTVDTNHTPNNSSS